MTDPRPTILILAPVSPRVREGCAAFADVVAIDGPDQLDRPEARDARAIATNWHWRIDDALLDRLPKLAMISSFGVGYDTIDLAALKAREITLSNTPDAAMDETADLALGLLLMTVRRLGVAERYLRDGRWAEAQFPLSATTLRDRTFGILGMGRIGQAIARRLAGFGRPILYHQRRRNPDLAFDYVDSAQALAERVDTLISVLPGGDSTYHMVDAALLAALGPRGVLINVGRGNAVDEAALLAALDAKQIAAAGLDVFEHEPHPLAGLVGRDDVVLLPHVGTATQFTRDAMSDMVVDNLRHWFATGEALTPVT
ncbi:2-hydroxyacid dehydrogenase [Sphingomonas nostoxanthinifaciens]|uniref:2-hydroxyacid dehydrogenase n=1 Tax=Sphingomonas nostoxanthinifaciens TaxID=2872652 RepID=UPI001CC1E02F|nr:2-hydroxyacid dehydrogenase [Sphingomonas nostoxanthinifaciens]UAK23547.1 2-hydroxyacid dehydrogenase [Sphingomonas nostoxanthinifaciens]